MGDLVALPTLRPGPRSDEPLLTMPQVARHFGVSVRTVERWKAAGAPHTSLGRLVRFHLAELEAWVERYAPVREMKGGRPRG